MSNIDLTKKENDNVTSSANNEAFVNSTNNAGENTNTDGMGLGNINFDKLNEINNQLNNTSEQVSNEMNEQFNNAADQLNNAVNQVNDKFNQFMDGIGNNNGVKDVTPDKLKVEPVVACILSVVLTGLGQMINGQLEKGLVILFGGMIVTFVVTAITCGFGAIIAPLIIAAAAIDAYKCATLLQNGVALGKWEFHILK